MGTTRNSNIELLRIVCILFVIIHHILTHGCGIYSGNLTPYPWFASYINQLCYVAVNVFVLISGYFTIRLSWKKVARIYWLCAIIGCLSYCLHCFEVGNRVGHSVLWNTIFPFSWSPVWYIPVYICLTLISPFLNILLENLNKKQYQWLIGILIIISCYFGWFWHGKVNTDGYSLFQFVTMYCVGNYIKKYKIECSLKPITWFAIWSCFALICTMLVYLFQTILSNNSFPPTPWIYSYNNPFLMVLAIGLFCLFARLNFKSRVVNCIATGTLGVYVIHANPFIQKFLFSYLSGAYLSSLFGVFVCGLVIYVLCWVVDLIIRKTFLTFLMSISEKTYNKLKTKA